MIKKTPDKDSIRDSFINNAINRLKNFGFIHVNRSTIFTDEVYRIYFFRILVSKSGENKFNDVVIEDLLEELKKK